MDDGRLADEMTLEGLSAQIGRLSSKIEVMDSKIEAMDSKIEAMDSKIETMDSKIDTVAQEMRDGFARVDDELRAAKIRDESLHSLMKFGLEAREVLRDEVGRRFDATDRKLDEQLGLLKDAVRSR